MTSTRAVLCLGFSLLALSASGEEPNTREFRQHYSLQTPDGSAIYDITKIVRLTSAAQGDRHQEAIYLMLDSGHGPLVLTLARSYTDQTSTYTIADTKGRTYVRATFALPFTAKTRQETNEEAKQNPELYDVPAYVTISTNGGEWTSLSTDADEWSTLRRLRHQMRPTVDAYLLEGIERMRGTFFSTEDGSLFHEVVGQYLVYDTTGGEPKSSLKKVDAAPDCAFDKSFGYECTDTQLERIRKAAESGTPRAIY